MQRATTPESASPPTGAPSEDSTCPVCGEPVSGIASAGPGEHRFVGCDHYASARVLRPRSEPRVTGGPRLRIGP